MAAIDRANSAQANAFLDTLFRGVSADEFYVNLWTLPDKKSLWVRPRSEFPEFPEGKDVYFTPGLTRQADSSNHRVRASTVDAITCIWADVDYGTEHKKNVPPDEATAGELVRKAKLHPSIVIHTGHGWHCYWLLNEPWIFASDTDRQAAANLIKNWQGHLRSIFKAAGYELDATHDLARVLRVPGTMNYKSDPLPVKICWPQDWNGGKCHVYNISDFGGKPKAKTSENGSGIDRSAVSIGTIDPEKFAVLMANSDVFKATWEQDRDDLSDTSPSGYDMALACQAAAVGWPDDEIAALLLEFRRKHKHDLTKITGRADYVSRTIERAKIDTMFDEPRKPGRPSKQTKKINSALSSEVNELLDQLSDKEKIEVICQQLKVPVMRILRQGQENTQFSVVLNLSDGEREVHIGNTRQFMDQRCFRERLFEATGEIPPLRKSGQWDKLCKLMFQVAMFIEDVESMELTQIMDWLRQYLDNQTVYRGKEIADCLKTDQPYIVEDNNNEILHVHSGSLLKYVRNVIQEQPAGGDVRRMLRKLGFEPKSVVARDEQDKVVHRNYWRVTMTGSMWDGF
ncbi:MAG: hypothetical protein JXD22_11585 [Sedimentisphaerales bacterium]|nr:hypothetical protein [Sedimentisphaerales bacterium]